MRTSGMRFQLSARIEPRSSEPIRAAVSREPRNPVSTPRSTTGRRVAGTPSSSKANVPSPRGVVGSAVMFMCSEPYRSDPRSSALRKLVPAYAASVP